MIERLCVIGVGLIGGSLARALREQGYCREVIGCGRGRHNLERALELGVIDRYEHDPARAVRGADMVVMAVPLGAIRPVLEALRPALDPAAVVTDVGSAKTAVIEAARQAFGELPARFVPGHPIAGTENSGVDSSFASLFRERMVILTPVVETSPVALASVRDMWGASGARVVEMQAAHHDEVLAATSHLPHLLAYILVDVLGRMDERVEIFRYAAGGFRDFTRIASSDPTMWKDICVANREAIVGVLERFSVELHDCLESVRRGDAAGVFELFARAKALRDRYARESAP